MENTILSDLVPMAPEELLPSKDNRRYRDDSCDANYAMLAPINVLHKHIRRLQIIEKMNFGSYTKLSPSCGKVVTFNANKEARNDIGSCKIMGQNSGTVFIKQTSLSYKYNSYYGEHHQSIPLTPCFLGLGDVCFVLFETQYRVHLISSLFSIEAGEDARTES